MPFKRYWPIVLLCGWHVDAASFEQYEGAAGYPLASDHEQYGCLKTRVVLSCTSVGGLGSMTTSHGSK